ncbi:MAG: hypothetical protein C0603_09715 [Denitrovibrio sp.]|nr:MAG: hypothetical protein C0603_09715 [Denitrovibrio sp.]
MSRIFITGATGVFGSELAHRLADRGHSLVLAYRDSNKLTALLSELSIYSADITAFEMDLSCKDSINEQLAIHIPDPNTIDVVINNAAIAGEFKLVEDYDIQLFQSVLDINLYGSLAVTRYFLKSMKERNVGKIFNICGGAIGWGSDKTCQSAYIVSKYALYGLVESIADEVADYEIVVNAVLPGPMESKLHDILVPETDGHRKPDLGKALDAMTWLVENANKNHSGKLISACWDNYKEMDDSVDLYTLKRVDVRNYSAR